MDSVSYTAGFREDAAKVARVAKNARGAGGSERSDLSQNFDALMAQLGVETAVPVPTAQPREIPNNKSVADETNQAEDETPTSAENPVANQVIALAVQPNALTTDALSNNVATTSASISGGNVGTNLFQTAAVQVAPDTAAAASEATPPLVGDATAILAQLDAVGIDPDAQIGAQASAFTGAATSALTATTNKAATNTAQSAAIQNGATDDPQNPAANSQQPTAPPVTSLTNTNANLQTTSKAKPAETVEVIKNAGQTPVTQSSTDAGQSVTPSQISDATLPTSEAARPQHFTPQTIPMLAATMIRRFENGARQFTMRLDPPELGQVEVKLTVGADKKVRAVVSADRPEALADLVRSARELTRALFDAGLDLEERGLTFTMNDPSGNQQQGNGRQERMTETVSGRQNALADQSLSELAHIEQSHTPNDPFQRWQRARIALTA